MAKKAGYLSVIEKTLGKGLGMLLVSGLACALARADESAIVAQFRPYSQGTPRVPGLEPGVTLTPTNVQLAREVLPDEVFQRLTAGDLEIAIQETTDLPPRPTYLAATLQHSQGVSLNGGHTLGNYRAGAPFPYADRRVLRNAARRAAAILLSRLRTRR